MKLKFQPANHRVGSFAISPYHEVLLEPTKNHLGRTRDAPVSRTLQRSEMLYVRVEEQILEQRCFYSTPVYKGFRACMPAPRNRNGIFIFYYIAICFSDLPMS